MTEPVPARPSATVILTRDGDRGPEIFLVRRHEQSGFANSAYVFPGGSVISADMSPESVEMSATLTPRAAREILHSRSDIAPDDATVCLSYWIASARELLEEGGVLLHDGSVPPSLENIARARALTLQSGERFADAVHALDLRLDLARLVYFSHWRTPVQSPKRYDTRFFITEMPSGQEATHCGIETTDAIWITPADALARSDAGELKIVFATRAHIERLVPYASVDALMEFAQSKTIRCVDAVIMPDRSIWIDPEVIDCW